MDSILPLPDHLPQANQLWHKIRTDLQSGVKLHGIHPKYTDVIKVWTSSKIKADHLPHQFLIIATAKQKLSLPVASIELFAYTKTSQSWKLGLIQHPFPQPHWRPFWQTLENGYSQGEPEHLQKQSIITTYLQSQIDTSNTHESYQTLIKNYSSERVSWINK